MQSILRFHRRTRSAGSDETQPTVVKRVPEKEVKTSRLSLQADSLQTINGLTITSSKSSTTLTTSAYQTTFITPSSSSSSLKKLNIINLFKKSNVYDSDSSGSDYYSTQTSPDVYREAGVKYGTRTHEWGSDSPQSPRVPSMSPVVQQSAWSVSETTVSGASGAGMSNSTKSLEPMPELDEATEYQEAQVVDQVSNNGVEEKQGKESAGDQRSIFSFEEDKGVGRNLSINYHKPAQSKEEETKSIYIDDL